MNAWIEAARPKTLPLAFASILLGSMLAYAQGAFQPLTLVLGLLTTLALQVLSNYANDLGDTLHGADDERRTGPRRLVQAGIITQKEMKRAVLVAGGFAFVLGIGLLVASLNRLELILDFVGLGVLSIAAAILYTNGSKPYGYLGLGDLFVLLFFGLVGVSGIHFLHTQSLNLAVLLPGFAAGLLAVAVLNLNNMRDIVTDAQAGKNTLPVLLGQTNARYYHGALLLGSLALFAAYNVLHEAGPFAWLYLVAAPLLIGHWVKVSAIRQPEKFAPYLKQMALLALLADVLFGLGHVLARLYPAIALSNN